MGIVSSLGKTVNQITGNVPKAILCVPDIYSDGDKSVEETIRQSNALRSALLEAGGEGVLGAFSGIAGRSTTQTIESNGYLALEVQYNPSSVYLESVAGTQMNFSPMNMGDASTNQLRQNVEPVATTMNVELIFDAVNVQDSFMLSNTAATVGNAVSAVADLAKKNYSVKPQIDGILSLLTRDYTRHVLFFWAKMCFQGELSSVSSHYTMFNTSGNPVRGVVRLTIRQSEDPAAKYENTYWEKAFTKAFGESNAVTSVSAGNTAASILNNSVLNLNL